MSISVFASVTPKQGQADFVEAELKKMVALTRAEPGCQRYDLYRAAQGEATFHLFETYADQAALAAHAQSAHFLAMREKLATCLAQPLEIKLLVEADVA